MDRMKVQLNEQCEIVLQKWDGAAKVGDTLAAGEQTSIT
jgi:hypothetical protein